MEFFSLIQWNESEENPKDFLLLAALSCLDLDQAMNNGLR